MRFGQLGTRLSVLVLCAVAGCSEADPLAPPKVYYGQDVCHVCGMIISDERFAAAAVSRDQTGRYTPMLFDDVGCLLGLLEDDAQSPALVATHVRRVDADEWIDLNQAVFVHSGTLKTPMAFGVAACANVQGATAVEEQYPGDVLDLEELQSRFRAGDLAIDPLRQRQ